MTALTVYGSNVASGTLSTACALSSITGGSLGSKTTTAPNDSTSNYLEVNSLGSTGTDYASLPTPTGNGWLFDVTTLENQSIQAGNWSGPVRINVTTGTMTADMIIRFYKRSSGGSYTSIGSITLSAQSLTTTTSSYSFPSTSLASMNFSTGDKLYLDFFVHPVSGSTWTGQGIKNVTTTSSTQGDGSNFAFTTPGYIAGTPTNKDITVRGRLAALAAKDITTRGRISALAKHDITVRGNIGNSARKDITTRGRLAALGYHDVTVRGRVSQTTKKDITVRGLLAAAIKKDITTRGRLAATTKKDITARGRLAALATHDITVRGNIIARNTAGGATLWGNGTGSISFDHFRWTQFPDPSLSFGPVLPRLGNSVLEHTPLVPAHTTFGEDISLDGVTWTDVTALSGTAFPGLYAQPLPTTDSFSTDTHTSYTSTFQTGGSVATWTYDTTNSRIIATNGSHALFLSTLVSRADVDTYIDMDMSDAGGLAWRYIDQNNFYLFTCTDTLSASGQQNTWTLSKIISNTTTQLATGTCSFSLGQPGNTYISTFTRSTHHRFRITVTGSLITGFYDGIQLFSLTDTSISSAGLIGLYTNGGITHFYNLWIQPLGDIVTGTPSGDIVTSTFAYTRQRLSSTRPDATPEVEDITLAASSPTLQFGASIPSIAYESTFVSKNLDDLAKQSNYYWYIDETKTLHFQAYQTIPSPWILQSAVAGLATIVDLDISGVGKTSTLGSNSNSTTSVLHGTNFELDIGNNLYRNRQTILGAFDISSARSEAFFGDGKQQTFPVALSVAALPTITVNGITQTVGVAGQSGFQWYYQNNDPHISQDLSLTPLSDADVLIITYTGYLAIKVVVDDTAAQAAQAAIEGGTGIVEDVEDHAQDNPPMLKAEALARAQLLIERYKVSGRTLVFDTSRDGLDIGQTLTLFLPEHGIWDGQFYIISSEIAMQKSINDTQTYWYKITASEMPKQASWAKLLASGLQLQTNWNT